MTNESVKFLTEYMFVSESLINMISALFHECFFFFIDISCCIMSLDIIEKSSTTMRYTNVDLQTFIIYSFVLSLLLNDFTFIPVLLVYKAFLILFKLSTSVSDFWISQIFSLYVSCLRNNAFVSYDFRSCSVFKEERHLISFN